MLEKVSAKAKDGSPCVTHVGPDGAGHFVKMVHNGIEYADMQLIGEAYQLLRDVAGYSPGQIAEIFRTWNTGRLDSYLIEITAEVLSHVDAATGRPFVDVVVDQAEQKGTGRWTAHPHGACPARAPHPHYRVSGGLPARRTVSPPLTATWADPG